MVFATHAAALDYRRRRAGRAEAANDAADPLADLGSRQRLKAGQRLFAQGDDAQHVYRVVSGCLRSNRLLEDGRRQVVGFHFAGDLVGLEPGDEHRCGAEAVGEAVVLRLRRDALDAAAAHDGAVAGLLWQLSMLEHRFSQEHASILGRAGACERVSAFLTELAGRMGGDALDLPMSRQDIADHLGLTIHTVSRTFSQLQEEGRIEADGPRRVRLRA
ncbi:MAG TPA: helix-turn-helix domain-containing protein [Caulobacteraceae bacterium]|nr:helix-turn-helix domain-containing protein [Caulobacteraceae bacterium]